ncbi:hypothetical protein ACIPJN_29850 [Streptomyces sp. NPDC086796]|uniref:hypothetical protein n=1 Tax=Streptomyces sp. NPDC086796 TaxID=3365760 RepID=UPI00382B2A04
MPQHPRLVESRATRDLGCYGQLEMVSTTRPGAPWALYRLHAPHVRGCLLLTPAAADDDPTAPRTRAADVIFDPAPQLDVGPLVVRPFTVNSIALTGPLLFNADDPSTVHPVRAGRTGQPEPMPPRTRQHARSVIAGVLEHWRKRSDREDLHRAAHRRAVLLHLSRYRGQMDRRRQVLEHARIAVAETGQRIAVLQDALHSADQTSPHILELCP